MRRDASLWGRDGSTSDEVFTVQSAGFSQHAVLVRLGLIHSFVAALEGIGSWMKVNAPEIEIVMRATSWSQAAKQAASRPNVLLVDVQNLAGPLLAVRIAAARSRGAAVVVWGDRADDVNAHELLDAGAATVLGRRNSLEDAREAIFKAAELAPSPQQLLATEPLPTGADGEVLHGVAELPGHEAWSAVAAANSAALSSARLTEADIEAVRLYANGHSPIDIALRMNIRFDRVKDHLARVREHYETQGRRASNRLDLVQRASEDGLLEA